MFCVLTIDHLQYYLSSVSELGLDYCICCFSNFAHLTEMENWLFGSGPINLEYILTLHQMLASLKVAAVKGLYIWEMGGGDRIPKLSIATNEILQVWHFPRHFQVKGYV